MRACRTAFTKALLKAAIKDESIVALCTDSRGSASCGEFAKALPGRFIECGIAEQNCVGVAAGLASAGFKPFVLSPASFLSTRAAEQVKIDCGYAQLNVKLFGVSGGVSYGALGASHHSLQDIAFMSAVPGMSVLLPSDAAQTAALCELLCSHLGPAYIRTGRGPVPDIYGSGGVLGRTPDFAIGRAVELCGGGEVLFAATGELVYHCLVAAHLLEREGISCCVLDIHTVCPLDAEALLSRAKGCRLVVTAEEHCIIGGLGSAVCSVLCENAPLPALRLGFPAQPVVSGSSAELFAHYGLDAAGIFKRVVKKLKELR